MPDYRVAPNKVTAYLLNPTSETGGPKARYFMGYGFRPGNPAAFVSALLNHPVTARLESVDATSPYGTKYVFRCSITTPNGGTPCIRTVWQLRDGDYWLVTAYPGP